MTRAGGSRPPAPGTPQVRGQPGTPSWTLEAAPCRGPEPEPGCCRWAGTGPAAGPVGCYPVQGRGSAVPGSFRPALAPRTRLRPRPSPGGLQSFEAQPDHGCPAEHAAQVQGLHALGYVKRHAGQNILREGSEGCQAAVPGCSPPGTQGQDAVGPPSPLARQALTETEAVTARRDHSSVPSRGRAGRSGGSDPTRVPDLSQLPGRAACAAGAGHPLRRGCGAARETSRRGQTGLLSCIPTSPVLPRERLPCGHTSQVFMSGDSLRPPRPSQWQA